MAARTSRSAWTRALTPRAIATAALPVVALGAITVVTWAAVSPADVSAGDARPSLAELAGILLLIVAPLAFRLAAPRTVLVVVALGLVAAAPERRLLVVVAVAAAMAAYTVGERAGNRVQSQLLLLGVALFVSVGALVRSGEVLTSLVLPFVVLVPAWVVGDAMRSRVRARQGAAERALRERELERDAAVADERRRMAREFHDILAHTVSVMVVQAGAARKVLPSSPDRADVALAAVEQTGREALSELRRVVGALDAVAETETQGIAPLPTLADLPRLVERVRAAGLPARLETSGAGEPVPASVQTASYRIVQEALTNALRHSGGAPTVVRILHSPQELRVEVSDTGRPAGAAAPTPGSGHGLVSMRERARLAGGRLDAGPGDDGGFAVSARFPLGDRVQEPSA